MRNIYMKRKKFKYSISCAKIRRFTNLLKNFSEGEALDGEQEAEEEKGAKGLKISEEGGEKVGKIGGKIVLEEEEEKEKQKEKNNHQKFTSSY